MSTVIAFIVFFAGVILSAAFNIALAYPLGLGVVCFTAAALWQRFRPEDILRMIIKGAMGALSVLRIFLLIGIMTGLWRSSGTIAFFVYYGIEYIPPQLFLLFAFLLPAAVSYMIGSFFGTVSTVGVVLLVLGQSGGIDTALLCGAIMSGASVGDRMAPTSACANLVSALTGTSVSENLRGFQRRAVVPIVLTAIIFGALSFLNPGQAAGNEITQDILATYKINLWLLVPAALVLVLPIFKVNVRRAVTASFVSAALITCFVQKKSFVFMLKSALFGYTPQGDGAFSQVIGGGGFTSMLSTALVLILACGCTGIFNGTHMLDGVEQIVVKMSKKIGLYPTTVCFGFFANMAFCAQTISVIMTEQMVRDIYEKAGKTKQEMALDISDSTAEIGAMIPWNLTCSVPLRAMLSGPYSAIPLCFYVYLQTGWTLVWHLWKDKRGKKEAH